MCAFSLTCLKGWLVDTQVTVRLRCFENSWIKLSLIYIADLSIKYLNYDSQ